ncbi:MAG: polysaccharide deacetylase family protein [Planctomycetota bacterium]|nr:polysaccharide deacetylase family protein [Planctomycetota bacterium]
MNAPPVARKNRLRQWVLWGLRLTISSRRLLVRGPANSRIVYLTFDDGPDPETTPRILDVLRRHSVQSTFFVVGEKAAAHPDLVRRLADEGHAVGGHTFFHLDPNQVNGRQLIEEVRATEDLLQKILGRGSRLFRPPFGKLTLGKLWRLWAEQRTIVLWNKDPKDFAASSTEQLAAWFRNDPLAGGDIVLLHDTSAVTAEALEEVISHTRRSGLAFAPLA